MTDTPQAMPVEIRHRHTSAVLYRSDKAKDVRAALADAVAAKANLDGANLGGANLGNGLKAQAGSRMAFAGPVGNSSRTVFAFLAQANDTNKSPFLVYRCGCFIGDEKQYRAKVAERYGKNNAEDKAWRKQCLVALSACRANAATWPKPDKKTK